MIDKHSQKPLDVILAKDQERRIRKLAKRHHNLRDLWSGKKLPEAIAQEILKDWKVSDRCRRNS